MSQKEVICGFEVTDCNLCPWMEDDHCYFNDEFREFMQWMYLLFKERARMNPIPWGSVWRIYYGPKDVYEWVLDDFPYEKVNKFWELWRDGGKKAFKRFGFGVMKDYDIWMLFWEVKHWEKFKEEFEIK